MSMMDYLRQFFKPLDYEGNGFIKIVDPDDREHEVHQCWDCDSEGEYYIKREDIG